MALWRCPHCGTPQPVTARCWVCRRSSTSCGTCRHFRASVAARIGFCGLDRERRPLAGDEIRGCWSGVLAVAKDDAIAATEAVEEVPAPPLGVMRGFVLVGSPPVPLTEDAPVPTLPAPAPVAVTPALPPDGMLWADLEG